MLVLSRKAGQVLVAGPLRLTVLEVRGGRVRLGLEAPEDWTIARLEVLHKFAAKALAPGQGAAAPAPPAAGLG